nr:hypothetical protein [Tanacetum cinerariifolium]
GPARPVVIKEPDSGRIRPLPEVQGKGKEKVVEEQAAHDLLTLQTPKNKSPVDQFIFQRRTPMPAEASGPAKSPSLDAELALIDSEIEFDDEVAKINTGDQNEGQARPNPDSENDNEKFNTPSFSSPGPKRIDEFDLKTETSLPECDEEEQNVLYFNDIFPFNIIYPDNSKSNNDNDDHEIDIKQSSGGNVINTDDGAYAHGSNKLLETSHDKSNKFFKAKTFIKKLNVNIMTWNHLNKGMSFIFLIKNLYVLFGIPFDPKLFYKDGIKLGKG